MRWLSHQLIWDWISLLISWMKIFEAQSHLITSYNPTWPKGYLWISSRYPRLQVLCVTLSNVYIAFLLKFLKTLIKLLTKVNCHGNSYALNFLSKKLSKEISTKKLLKVLARSMCRKMNKVTKRALQWQIFIYEKISQIIPHDVKRFLNFDKT